jgi:hypothetical protein
LNKIHTPRPILFFSLAALLALALPAALAADWGIVASEQFEAGIRDATEITSKTVLAPWLSLPLGDKADLYLSVGGSFRYDQEKPELFPELFRLEASLRPVSSLTIRAGRADFRDPSLFTAKGRFDGLDITWDPGPLRLSLSGWYTGLLYRNTANISATPGDPLDYGAVLDYGDFRDTYFAPRRFLASLQLEYPGFISHRGALSAGVLSQYDLSDAPERLHTQYALVRYALSLPGGFADLSAAGAASLRLPGDGKAAFAASLEAGFSLPGSFADRLSLGGRWASGEGPSTAAYFPVIREAQGAVLAQSFSGLMVLKAGYEARFLPSLSAEAAARYFLRTDSFTFSDPYLKAQDESYFLGLEASLSLRWAPFSDLSFTLSGGMFFPRTGMAFRDDAPLYRRVTVGAICSF